MKMHAISFGLLVAVAASALPACGDAEQEQPQNGNKPRTWEYYVSRLAPEFEDVVAERGIALSPEQRAELEHTGRVYGVLPQDAYPVRFQDGTFDIGAADFGVWMAETRTRYADILDEGEVSLAFLTSLEHGLIDFNTHGNQLLAARVVQHHGFSVPEHVFAPQVAYNTTTETAPEPVGCIIWCNSVHSGDDDWFDSDSCTGDQVDNGGDDWEKWTYSCWIDATQNNCAPNQLGVIEGGKLQGYTELALSVTIPDVEETSVSSTGGNVTAKKESGCPGTSKDVSLAYPVRLHVGKGAKIEEKSESRKHIGFTGSGSGKKSTNAPGVELGGDAKVDVSIDHNTIKTVQSDPQVKADAHTVRIEAFAEGPVYVPVGGTGSISVSATTDPCSTARSSIWGKAKAWTHYETEDFGGGGLTKVISAADCPAAPAPAPAKDQIKMD